MIHKHLKLIYNTYEKKKKLLIILITLRNDLEATSTKLQATSTKTIFVHVQNVINNIKFELSWIKK